ncbi:MAG: RDD family protein, partial [Vicinamibacteria bacterium]
AAAFLIDLVIGVVLFMLVGLAVVWVIAGDGGHVQITTPETRAAQTDMTRVELKFFSNWQSVVWWVLYFGLATYLGKGQTPGKRIMRIRVVSLVHGHLGLWHSIERALGYGASALEFGFGFVQYFIHRNHRTVHDRIAETIVVDVPRASPAKGAR